MPNRLHFKEYIQTIESLLADEEFSLAVERSEEALRWYPEAAVFHRSHATALVRMRDATGALTILQEAVSHLPTESSLFTALGNLYISEFRDFVRAEQQFARAINLNANGSDGYVGYAECRLQQVGFEELWREQPDWALPQLVLEAFVLQLRNYGRYSEAKSAALRLLQDFGRHPAALLALARIEEEAAHDLAAARRHITAALHLSPTSIPGHLAYLSLLIKAGKWADASRHLRSMMKYFGYSYSPFVSEARNWDGSPLEGKTVLLDSNLVPGYGDFIHFSRFAAALQERGATVGVRTRKRLKSLLATASAVDFTIAYSEPVRPADYMAEMSLLWLFLGIGMKDVAANVPYLKADAAALERWNFARDGTLRVGLVPRSAGRHPFNRHTAKNVPVQEFAALAGLPGVRFYSFEMPPTSPALPNVLNSVAVVADFFETAAVFSQMDVVVTVDTAMAHLTGALNKPGFLLLPYSPDWRWMLNREDTPWYPSLRLIRQPAPGDWHSVMQQCAAELAEFARQNPAPNGRATYTVDSTCTLSTGASAVARDGTNYKEARNQIHSVRDN
jgi:tetratricopeptide (TPR) repeat protein